MRKDYDVMLTGIAAAQAMRAAFMGLEEEPMVGSEDGSDIEEERYSDDRLYGPPADAETPILEAIDWHRYGSKADARFFRDMRRLAARLALPAVIEQKLEMVAGEDGKLPILERIRAAQEGRHIQHLAILRRGQPPTIPAPAPETAPEIADTKPEIVHEPIGDTASPEYVAEQDALEHELAARFPSMYTALFGGYHAPLLNLGDAERLQRTDPEFDDRMHEALSRIRPIIQANPRRATFQEVSPTPNQQPARRESERP